MVVMWVVDATVCCFFFKFYMLWIKGTQWTFRPLVGHELFLDDYVVL